MIYKPIQYKTSAANCPYCGAYANIIWGDLDFSLKNRMSKKINYYAGECQHCHEYSIWMGIFDEHYMEVDQKLIYPLNNSCALPNEDLPHEIKRDYMEAAQIVMISPRGASALLRLAVQKLCQYLGEKGDDINTDIKSLVEKGLNPNIQKALDSIRVIGNQAVHPGYLDLHDDRETAIKLFDAINFIADNMITQPKKINELYDSRVSEQKKEAINRRDNKT